MNKAPRFQRRRQKYYRPTRRDLEIVQAVWEARYLTNNEINDLFFSGGGVSSSCKSRIRKLYDAGYLAKRKAHLNEPDIYCLGLKGKRFISDKLRLEKEYVNQVAGVSGSRSQAPMLMMGHELALSQLYSSARRQAKSYGFSYRWLNTRQLELLKLGFQPDAFLEVSYRGRSRAAFIEITKVMPRASELKAKVTAYGQYMESGRCEADLGVPQVDVMWFTTSASRAHGLRVAINKSIYKDVFIVGQLSDKGHFLTGKVFAWSQSREKVAWVGVPEEVLYEG